ncbi:co-chaperone HscB [Zobellella sp. DQSA1]|uniref:co-chaperone HscB n=1 Tax=Zobellella sp. DQSA1 TaxID=3342386 RepID=UPI0035C1ED0C
MNYFELFGLPVQFALDSQALAGTYRQLQMQFHPDKFASRPERERLLAVQRAAQINDAFTTLKQPLNRAEYLLSLYGIDIRAEQQTLKDPLFLMQQMEWREQLETIPEANDVFGAIMAFERELGLVSAELFNELERQLDTSCWQEAADTVRKLKFMTKLHAELERLEDAQQEL